MKDYQIAHSIKELREWALKGYEFVAIITPNDWLVGKNLELSAVFLPPLNEVQPVPMPDIKLDNKMSLEDKPKTIKQIKDGKSSSQKSTRE